MEKLLLSTYRQGDVFNALSTEEQRIETVCDTGMATGAAVLYTFLLGLDGVGKTYLVGFLASLILLRKENVIPDYKVIYSISKLTFGIYLLHPLLLLIFWHFGVTSLLQIFSAFIASAIIASIASKILPKNIAKYVL